MVTISGIIANGFTDDNGSTHKPFWGSGYPSIPWALGVGAALLAFAGVTVVASAQGLVSGILNLFSRDGDPLSTLAKSMVTISDIIANGFTDDNGTYKPSWGAGFPSVLWATGVGSALMEFSAIAVAASANGLISGDDTLGSLAKSMVKVSTEISKGVWGTNHPSSIWANEVSTSLMEFSSLNGISFDDDDVSSVEKVSTSISKVSTILSTNKWKDSPSTEWVDNVVYLLEETSDIISDSDLDMEKLTNFDYLLTTVLPNFKNLSNFPNIDPFTENMNKFSTVINSIPDDKHKAIKNLANSIKEFSNSLESINVEAIDSLVAISQGVMLVSITDDTKLKSVLNTISEKEAELKEIYGEKDKENILEKAGNFFADVLGLSSDDDSDKTTPSTIVEATHKDSTNDEFNASVLIAIDSMSKQITALNSTLKKSKFNSNS
jgi:hypothetical protein